MVGCVRENWSCQFIGDSQGSHRASLDAAHGAVRAPRRAHGSLLGVLSMPHRAVRRARGSLFWHSR
eukprot:4240400-Pyramimonas_sp.AAC.1